MNTAALGTFSMSPLTMIVAFVGSLLIGTALLMAVVRWTEGFAISFLSALKMTALGLFAGLVCELLIFAALFFLGVTSMAVYWWAVAIAAILSIAAFTVVYARSVTKPTGEQIGLARAVKVTLLQTALYVAVLFVIAIIVAVLVVNGIVKLPELPPGMM